MQEAEIIRLIQEDATREMAFNCMVKLYQQSLYWHIRRMVPDHDDADDVLQNTFIKVWKSLTGFRGESKLRTWVYRIATNECLTFLEGRKRRGHTDIGEVQNLAAFSHVGAAGHSGEEILRKLMRAIETLPDKQKLVFNMKYFDELTYEEMAGVLGGTTGSLKASFHHAARKIEKFLEDELNLQASPLSDIQNEE